MIHLKVPECLCKISYFTQVFSWGWTKMQSGGICPFRSGLLPVGDAVMLGEIVRLANSAGAIFVG